jgi:kynureninase
VVDQELRDHPADWLLGTGPAMLTCEAQNPPSSRDECAARDAADPLGKLEERFFKPQGIIYLDGNSLGPLPKAAPARLDDLIRREWGNDLILSWNKAGWFDLPVVLGDRLGKLIGAGPGQTVVCDTTSINIYKCLHAALSLEPGRSVIVSEEASFPTDLYMLEGVLRSSGGTRRLWNKVDALDGLLDGDVAAVLLSQVDYRTGALLDMEAITRKVQASGALMIWDLCHSAGIIPIVLDACGVDFAIGCTYKYLNGGPGAPAFLYAAARHHSGAHQPLSGWWGHASPFAFERDYRPDNGIKKFLCGTQPILSMVGVACGLDAVDGVPTAALRRKSGALTGLFIDRVDKLLRSTVEIVTPRDPERRGSQVSVRFEHGYAVVQAMIAEGVIGDFRDPDIMRFGFAPLYTTFNEVWDAAECLAQCIARAVWCEDRFTKRAKVT